MISDAARSRQKMPTAAKAVAAIGLAIVGVGIADILTYRYPALSQTGVNPILFATVGFCIGWAKIGPAADIGYRAAWQAGISAAYAAALITAILAAIHHIYGGMMYHAYKTVDEMLTGFMKKTMEHMTYVLDPYVLIALAFGGLLAGVFAGFAARLWR